MTYNAAPAKLDKVLELLKTRRYVQFFSEKDYQVAMAEECIHKGFWNDNGWIEFYANNEKDACHTMNLLNKI